ncbi:hypothetical protein [Nonomuraea sp. NPDC005650]|uniref:hypothetical protein n=1 Tax=Nonomuraea sp. NPDC005650 TaxID=3157045 RepID=UPI0033BD8D58
MHQSAVEAAATVSEVASHLATGMFGDGDNADRTAEVYYRGLGRLCADVTHIDRAALNACAAPQLEALRRGALDLALREFQAGRKEAAHAAVNNFLVIAGGDGELAVDESRSRHFRPRVCRAMRGTRAGEAVVSRWNAQTVADGENLLVEAVEVGDDLERAADEAMDLLAEALPVVAPDVLRCAYGLVPITGAIVSGHFAQTPKLIFVNVSALRNVHDAAESILHESLHQKLFDIGLARTIFRPGYVDAESHTIPIPWSGNELRVRRFSADRAVSAYHVYVHQTLLYLALLTRRRSHAEPDPEILHRIAVAWARAREFRRGLHGDGARTELGEDGLAFLHWLDRAHDALGAVVLPDGSALAGHEGSYASSVYRRPAASAAG